MVVLAGVKSCVHAGSCSLFFLVMLHCGGLGGLGCRIPLACAMGVGMFLLFSVLSLGGCKSLGLAAPAVLPCTVSPCIWIHRHIRCWVLCCWLVIFMHEAGSIVVLLMFTVLLIVVTLLPFLCHNHTVIFAVCA